MNDNVTHVRRYLGALGTGASGADLVARIAVQRNYDCFESW